MARAACALKRMVPRSHKALLCSLLVLSALLGGWFGEAARSPPPPPLASGGTPDAPMSPAEMCAHMPEHCPEGNATHG
jgi:hypothetical protein